MTIDWHYIIDSILGSSFLGIALKSAKSRGAHAERLKDMNKAIMAHAETLASHTAQLAAGEGNFKVIDSKLDTIKEGQKEIRDLFIQHITKEPK